jgi:tRNA splicing endonuclease
MSTNNDSADPRFCHSALVVTVCGQAERFTFTQLVGLGRLGTTVRKARLFASVAEASDAQHPLLETASDPHWPVMYLRVEWAGW